LNIIVVLLSFSGITDIFHFDYETIADMMPKARAQVFERLNHSPCVISEDAVLVDQKGNIFAWLFPKILSEDDEVGCFKSAVILEI
jgi:hypothetical protein